MVPNEPNDADRHPEQTSNGGPDRDDLADLREELERRRKAGELQLYIDNTAGRVSIETYSGPGTELREWALQLHPDEAHLAGLKELQEKGGTELGEVIERLKQRRIERESTKP